MIPREQVLQANVAQGYGAALAYEIVFQPGYYVMRCVDCFSEDVLFEGVGATAREAIAEAQKAAAQ